MTGQSDWGSILKQRICVYIYVCLHFLHACIHRYMVRVVAYRGTWPCIRTSHTNRCDVLAYQQMRIPTDARAHACSCTHTNTLSRSLSLSLTLTQTHTHTQGCMHTQPDSITRWHASSTIYTSQMHQDPSSTMYTFSYTRTHRHTYT